MIEIEKIPRHLAIILDGNGRWAKKRGLPRNVGHARGSDNVKVICKEVYNIGIKYLTLYAFSTENWKRPKKEVDELMNLLSKYMKDAIQLSRDNNMRVRVIGDRTVLTPVLQDLIKELEETSKNFTGLSLQIAINYGGRDEIVRAFKSILREAVDKQKTISELESELTEELLTSNLDTADLPDPDLMIRTSGEQRLSNYLIWQLAYAEFFFTPTLWPDFSRKDLLEAIDFYNSRERKFGGLQKGN